MKYCLGLFLIIFSISSFAQELDTSSIPYSVKRKLEIDSPELFIPPYSYEKLDNLIRKLYLTERFSKVEVYSRAGNYVVKTTELPKITKILFLGEFIEDEINFRKLFPLKENDLLSRSKAVEGANLIKEYLGRKSYLTSKISIDFTIPSPGSIEIKINIDQGQASQIQDIQFLTGNQNLKSKLDSIASEFVGKEFSETKLFEIRTEIRDFFRKESYLTAKLNDPNIEYFDNFSKVKLNYKVDSSFKYKLIFNNNKKLSRNEIMKKLNLENSEPLGISPEAELRERLIDIYKEQAYTNVKIRTETDFIPEDYQKSIRFQIEEGERVQIDDIEFIGRLSRDSKYYRDWIFDNGSELTQDEFYNAKFFEEDLKKLIISLQNEGFLRAKLISSRVRIDESKEKVKIRVNIDEGKKTYLRQVNFIGAKHFSKSALLEKLELVEGKPLLLKKIEQSFDKIISLYKQEAFLFVKVEREPSKIIHYTNEDSYATLNFIIQEGDQVIVDSILTRGNTFTKDYVITKVLTFKEGDYLTQNTILESESNLKRLGLFGSVKIQVQESQSPRKIVYINLQERNPGVLTFGVGISDELELTLRGYTGVAYRNLWGTARAIQGRVGLNANVRANDFIEQSINASYLEPFLFGSRTKGKISLINRQQITDFDTNIIEATESNEILFLLERDITRYFKVIWQLWGLAATRKFQVENQNVTEELQIAEMGPSIEIDYRDNAFLPRQGTFTIINFSYSDPSFGSSSTVNFFRTRLSFQQYFPLTESKRFVYAYALSGGYLRNVSRESNGAVPEERLFFLGGRSTIRGFDYNSIPNDAFLTQPGANFATVDTESYFSLIKQEFRFPIYGDIGMALFYDGGAVWVRGVDFDDTYRDAVGIAVQYNTPIGAVSLAYGFKLDRRTGEAPGAIHFSIGDF